jgi:hypothetical protein
VIKLRCKNHPKYKIIRKPRTGCGACWFLWKIVELINRKVYSGLEEVE